MRLTRRLSVFIERHAKRTGVAFFFGPRLMRSRLTIPGPTVNIRQTRTLPFTWPFSIIRRQCLGVIPTCC